jgi:hypothetical protein
MCVCVHIWGGVSFAVALVLIFLCEVSVIECGTANLAWGVAIVKFALEVKSVHRVVALSKVSALYVRLSCNKSQDNTRHGAFMLIHYLHIHTHTHERTHTHTHTHAHTHTHIHKRTRTWIAVFAFILLRITKQFSKEIPKRTRFPQSAASPER